jgi:tRNA pseudouridine38-40 synthase
MPRYALLLAYDGSAFGGWWRQAEARSVAGELDAAFARLGEPQAAALGASRTDAGVHARGQVAHVDCARTWVAGELQRALNRQLPSDVVCRSVARVADDWHAVHLAGGKTYRYRLDVGDEREPFLAPRISWRLPFAIDLAGLQAAARILPGTHDLQAFARRGEHREDQRTTLQTVRWYDAGRYRIAQVRGTRFTYRLVRSLVGGMVAVAHGTVSDDQWQRALAGEVTPAAQQQAPAHGLCLEHVHYPRPPDWADATARGM